MTAIISVKNLCRSYQMGDETVHALADVTLDIAEGDFVAIMGPSGSGKSTLMHVLGLLDAPSSGTYELSGLHIHAMAEDEVSKLRSETVGFVFQQFNLLARTSALENVALPMLYAFGKSDLARAAEVLTQVGLGDRLGHRPNELSGGQQQRVAIARALVNRPRIIFADEPTGNLDSATEKEIMNLLTDLNNQGITVIVVTHEPEIATYVNRVIKMRDGRIASDERQTPLAGSHQRSLSGRAPLSMVRSGRGSKLALAGRHLATHFSQAIRALTANKVRSLLSMLGILIGVGAIIAMLALGTGAQESIKAQLSSLGSNLLVLRSGGVRIGGVNTGSGGTSRLMMDDVEAIRAVTGVRRASPNVQGRTQAVFEDHNWSTQVMGVGPDYAEMRAANPVVGRFLTADDDIQRMRVAVIGSTVVRELFAGRQPVGETIKLNRVSFQVIGVLPTKGGGGFMDQDDMVIIPVTTAMKRLLGKKYLDSIDIEAIDAESIAEVQSRVETMINERYKVKDPDQSGFQIRNMADIQEAMSSTSRIMSALLASIASISLLVGGIGIMNIMLVSVTERTREIGLRKAIGATRTSIRYQFIVEAALVSFTGGGLGILLGLALAVGLSHYAGWSTRVSVESVVLAAGFSGAVGIVFGYWPARKASALNPIEALRHE